MNIFASSDCPIKSANNLDSKRVNKMLLESCQMLSTAINEHGGIAPYRSTHKNHPSNVWTRQTKGNYAWLWTHAYRLAEIYEEETGRVHKCKAIVSQLSSVEYLVLIPDGNITPIPNCAANSSLGVSFKHIPEVTDAYKQYLCVRWDNDKLKPKWGNRPVPTFYNGIYA